MSGHTPGPWSVEFDVAREGDIDVMTPDMMMVARVDCKEEPDDDDSPPREEAIANSRLIAAAPELLEAAAAIVAAHQQLFTGVPLMMNGSAIDHTLLNKANELAQRAIAKAEGRS